VPRRIRRLPGLKVRDKRERWKAAPKRLLWRASAAAPGVVGRFERLLSSAAATSRSQKLTFLLPFPVAERALGDAAIIDANPARIIRWVLSEVKGEGGIQSPRDYFLIDGPMRGLIQALDNSRLDREVSELVACEGNYRSTRVYRRLMRRMKKPHIMWHNGMPLRSADDVEAYCRHHLMLIESIREHGVVRRSELGRIAESASRLTANSAALERAETDAGVAIGTRGRLYRYRGGFHRTAAARELGLPSMPVQVKLVHLDWLRQMIKETGLPAREAMVEGFKRFSVRAGHDRTGKGG
jgi:hypothetical protein